MKPPIFTALAAMQCEDDDGKFDFTLIVKPGDEQRINRAVRYMLGLYKAGKAEGRIEMTGDKVWMRQAYNNGVADERKRIREAMKAERNILAGSSDMAVMAVWCRLIATIDNLPPADEDESAADEDAEFVAACRPHLAEVMYRADADYTDTNTCDRTATNPCDDCGGATAEDGVCEEVACDKPEPVTKPKKVYTGPFAAAHAESDRLKALDKPEPVTRARVEGECLLLASHTSETGHQRYDLSDRTIDDESEFLDGINATIDNAVRAALGEVYETVRGFRADGLACIAYKHSVLNFIDTIRQRGGDDGKATE